MIQYFLCLIKAHFPINAVCSECSLETNFSGISWFRTDKYKYVSYQYQCQDCGKLIYSNEFRSKEEISALSKRCRCGGQYRRDKNIFCPGCHHRKNKNNKTEDYLTLKDNDLERLRTLQGTNYFKNIN